MKSKWYTYLIRSLKDGSIYTGVTQNLTHRIYEHNNKLTGFTKSKAPWILIWYCVFSNQTKAEEFEKYLKSGTVRAFANKHLL